MLEDLTKIVHGHTCTVNYRSDCARREAVAFLGYEVGECGQCLIFLLVLCASWMVVEDI